MEPPETMEGKETHSGGGMMHSNPMEKWDKVRNLEVMDISPMTLTSWEHMSIYLILVVYY